MPFMPQITNIPQAQNTQGAVFRAPQRPQVSMDMIKAASGSPLAEAASKAMSELGGFISDRAFQNDLSKADGLESLMTLQPTSAKQFAMLQQKEGQFNALQAQALQKQQMQTAAIQQQVAQQGLQDAELFTKQKQQAIFALQADDMANMPKNVVDYQKGLPELQLGGKPVSSGFTPFDKLNLTDRIRNEQLASPKGTSATLELLDKQASRTDAKRDRLAQLQVARDDLNNAIRSGDKNQIRQAQAVYDAMYYSSGERMENTNISQAEEGVTFGRAYAKAGIDSYKKWNQQDWSNATAKEEAYLSTKKGAAVKELMKPYIEKSNAINDVVSSGNTLRSLVESGKYKTGAIDTTVSELGKYLTRDARGVLGYDEDKFQSYIKGSSEIGMAIADYVRSVSGLAVTDTEFKRLEKIIAGTDYQDESARLYAINAFTDSVVKKYKGESTSMAEAGAGATAANGWHSATRNYNNGKKIHTGDLSNSNNVPELKFNTSINAEANRTPQDIRADILGL